MMDPEGRKAGKRNASPIAERIPALLHLLLNSSGTLATTKAVPPRVAPVKVTSETRPTAANPAWSRLEAEVIGLFVQLSRIIGVPRSYAEIYALLFLSPQPLTMDEITQRLGISKGSASQGLNFLRKAGAIRMAHLPGRRAAQYEAVAELRHLAAGFLQDQILPQVEDSQSRLDLIAGMVAKLPARERAQTRRKITMLQSWGRQTRQFLPMVVEMMGA